MRDSQDYTAQTIDTESSNTQESCLQNHLGVLDEKRPQSKTQMKQINKSKQTPVKSPPSLLHIARFTVGSKLDKNLGWWIQAGGVEEAHQTSKSLVPSWCHFLQPGKFTNRPFCTPIMGGLVRIDYPLPSPKTQHKTTRTFTWSSCSCLVAHVPGKIKLSCRQRTGLATSQSQQRPPSFTSQGFHFMSFRNYESITYPQKNQCFRTTPTILASQQTSSTSISLRKSGGFTRIFFKPRYKGSFATKKHNKKVGKMYTSKWWQDEKGATADMAVKPSASPRHWTSNLLVFWVNHRWEPVLWQQSCFQFGINSRISLPDF